VSCARRSVTRASSCALVVHRLLCSSVCKCSLCHVPAVPCLGPPCHRSYWPYWPQVIFALLATGHIYPIGHRSYLPYWPQVIFATDHICIFPTLPQVTFLYKNGVCCHASRLFTHNMALVCLFTLSIVCVCLCVCAGAAFYVPPNVTGRAIMSHSRQVPLQNALAAMYLAHSCTSW